MSETRTEKVQYAPVFVMGEDRFVVLHPTFVADDHEGAWQIGLGAQLVECILWGAKNTHDVLRIEDGKVPHVGATLAGTRVALISGPMFDANVTPEVLAHAR